MSVRSLFLASVCSVFLAASAAASGAEAATPGTQLVSQAYKALQVGDAATAVTTYTKAIESRKLAPEILANALLNRGLAYQRLNEHDLAINDYTAAMRIDAMSGKLRALGLYNRGLSFQRLQKNAQAIEDFTSALFLDGQFAHAYYSRGTLLRDQGQHLFALADFDKALRFNYPDPARVYFAESITFERLSRPGDAQDSLKKAIAANPGYEPAVQRLAVLEGRAMPQMASASSSDQIQTSAVTPAKPTLPVAAAPSAAMLAEANAAEQPATKKFTDRVPAEAPAAKVVPASASPEPVERILAVEEVPDEPPSASAAAEEAEAPASEQPSPKLTGWAVQIASASSEDAAWSTWKKMKARNKALAAKEPVVVRADLGTKGIFYRVRLVGFESQQSAQSECSKLKSRGVKCFISRAAS